MGLFTTCGGLSRVFGPIGTSALYQHFGTYWTYGAILIVLGIALIMAIVSFRKFKVRQAMQERLPSKSSSNAEDQNGSSSTIAKSPTTPCEEYEEMPE